MLAEKLRRQQMQEEADLELAKEAFGVYQTTNMHKINIIHMLSS